MTSDGGAWLEGADDEPITRANPPGLRELSSRPCPYEPTIQRLLRNVGRVSVSAEPGQQALRPLRRLNVDADNDWTLGLLRAWAGTLEVLSFYQERLVQEHYFRTAVHRKSVRHLIGQIGDELRPPLAASALLAVQIVPEEEGGTNTLTLKKNWPVQSVPPPGSMPQVFETDEELEAHASWNELHLTPPAPKSYSQFLTSGVRSLRLAGLPQDVQVGSLLLIVSTQPEDQNGLEHANESDWLLLEVVEIWHGKSGAFTEIRWDKERELQRGVTRLGGGEPADVVAGVFSVQRRSAMHVYPRPASFLLDAATESAGAHPGGVGLPSGPIHDSLRTQQGVLLAATDLGTFRSEDNGRTWQAGTMPQPMTIMCLEEAESHDLYCAGDRGMVMRSRDHGRAWHSVSGQFQREPGFIGKAFALILRRGHPLPQTVVRDLTAYGGKDSVRLLAATDEGVFRSKDGGRRWRPFRALPRSVILTGLSREPCLSVAARKSFLGRWRLFAGTESGVYRLRLGMKFYLLTIVIAGLLARFALDPFVGRWDWLQSKVEEVEDRATVGWVRARDFFGWPVVRDIPKPITWDSVRQRLGAIRPDGALGGEPLDGAGVNQGQKPGAGAGSGDERNIFKRWEKGLGTAGDLRIIQDGIGALIAALDAAAGAANGDADPTAAAYRDQLFSDPNLATFTDKMVKGLRAGSTRIPVGFEDEVPTMETSPGLGTASQALCDPGWLIKRQAADDLERAIEGQEAEVQILLRERFERLEFALKRRLAIAAEAVESAQSSVGPHGLIQLNWDATHAAISATHHEALRGSLMDQIPVPHPAPHRHRWINVRQAEGLSVLLHELRSIKRTGAAGKAVVAALGSQATKGEREAKRKAVRKATADRISVGIERLESENRLTYAKAQQALAEVRGPLREKLVEQYGQNFGHGASAALDAGLEGLKEAFDNEDPDGNLVASPAEPAPDEAPATASANWKRSTDSAFESASYREAVGDTLLILRALSLRADKKEAFPKGSPKFEEQMPPHELEYAITRWFSRRHEIILDSTTHLDWIAEFILALVATFGLLFMLRRSVLVRRQGALGGPVVDLTSDRNNLYAATKENAFVSRESGGGVSILRRILRFVAPNLTRRWEAMIPDSTAVSCLLAQKGSVLAGTADGQVLHIALDDSIQVTPLGTGGTESGSSDGSHLGLELTDVRALAGASDSDVLMIAGAHPADVLESRVDYHALAEGELLLAELRPEVLPRTWALIQEHPAKPGVRLQRIKATCEVETADISTAGRRTQVTFADPAINAGLDLDKALFAPQGDRLEVWAPRAIDPKNLQVDAAVSSLTGWRSTMIGGRLLRCRPKLGTHTERETPSYRITGTRPDPGNGQAKEYMAVDRWGTPISLQEHEMVLEYSHPDDPLVFEHALVRLASGVEGKIRGLMTKTAIQHVYDPTTVTLQGNVVLASHGQTISGETLGSSDASRAHQQYPLRHAPLTHRVSGETGTSIPDLTVTVNGVTWSRAQALFGRGPHERLYVLHQDESGNALIEFGDGREGARPPTNQEGVIATYRKGAGPEGNVLANSITQPLSDMAGVAKVSNPLPASGGMRAESTEDALRRLPATLRARQPLIASAGLGDFASSFEGVGNATVHNLTDARGAFLYLSFTDTAGQSVPSSSALFVQFEKAIRLRWSAQKPRLVIASANRVPVTLRGTLEIHPSHLPRWTEIHDRAIKALCERYSAGRHGVGQSIHEAEIEAQLQSIRGVRTVRLETLARSLEQEGGGAVSGVESPLTPRSPGVPPPGVGESSLGGMKVRPAEFLALDHIDLARWPRETDAAGQESQA